MWSLVQLAFCIMDVEFLDHSVILNDFACAALFHLKLLSFTAVIIPISS